MDEEIGEKICVERFLNWYNKQHQRNYIYQKAETRFSDLRGELRWDFVAYEHDKPEEWIGVEVKEIAIVREDYIRLKFWQDLCSSELTPDLEGRGIQGKFGLIRPPDFDLKRREHPEFREAFVEVLCQKAPNIEVNEAMDIGPNIASKFRNWPREKSHVDEYDKWGEYRPSKLLITKRTGLGCKVSLDTGRLRAGFLGETHKEAFFNDAFRIKNGDIRANKQLRLAKEWGARETILLLACSSFVYQDLIEDPVQNLDHHLIPHIDCIYHVDMGKWVKDRVVKMYPS